MKKGDKILIGAVLLLAGLAFLWMQLIAAEGSKVVVRIDGQETAIYDLNEDINITIQGKNGGSNTLVIQNGQASITEADCPDKLCVNQGEIHRSGETIVCLPHRVVIEIQGGEESAVDGVVQ